MNILERINHERQQARDQLDPLWNLCVLATVNAGGEPEVRTLVLRDLSDGGWGIFFNATSPKWTQLQRQNKAAVLLYFPSLAIQYRLGCTTKPMPDSEVHDSWQLRPTLPKQMDWLYATHPQSTSLESRSVLLGALATLTLPEPLHAPDSAKGVRLVVQNIDRLDLNLNAEPHDRRAYRLTDGVFEQRVLVP